MSHHRIPLTAALLLSLPLAACNSSDDPTNAGGGGGGVNTPTTLLGLLTQRGLTTLADAVAAAGLGSALEAAGPLTLFAPTNDAFDALPSGELQRLLQPANVAELRALLLYHLVDQKYLLATLEGLSSLASVQGDDLLIDAPGGVVFVNDARIRPADVQATNGILHEVDSVLLPPRSLLATLDARGFTILSDLITRAGLAGALTGGNVTLVAPTDAAWNALPAGRLDHLRDPANQAELVDLLSFHVLPGRRGAYGMLLDGDSQNLVGDLLFACVDGHIFRVNGTPCPRFNVPATDGLLHLASGVLDRTLPVRQVLDGLGLTTLASLVDAAGLAPLLSAQGATTVIAPSEAAFAAQGAGFVSFLLDPANQTERLQFLQRHLVLDALQADEIARRDDLTMLGGQVYTVDPSSGLRIGGVLVVDGDRFASNGIVQVVDEILP